MFSFFSSHSLSCCVLFIGSKRVANRCLRRTQGRGDCQPLPATLKKVLKILLENENHWQSLQQPMPMGVSAWSKKCKQRRNAFRSIPWLQRIFPADEMIAEWFECIGANYSGNGETLLRNASPRKCPHCCCCQGIQKRLILWVLCASQLGGVKIPAERWTHPWSPKTCPDPALPLRIVVFPVMQCTPSPCGYYPTLCRLFWNTLPWKLVSYKLKTVASWQRRKRISPMAWQGCLCVWGNIGGGQYYFLQ